MLSFFRQIILGRQRRLRTQLSTDEVLSRLAQRMGAPQAFEVLEASKSYIGIIKGRKFWLLLQHRYRNGLSPKVKGEVSESDFVAEVDLHVRVEPLVWIITTVVFLLFLVLAIILIYLSGLDEWIDLFMLFPLFFFSLIFVLVLVAIRQAMESMEDDLAELWGGKYE